MELIGFLMIVGGALSVIWQGGWLGLVAVIVHVAIMCGAIEVTARMRQSKPRYQPPNDQDD